jgi:CIC family chloride channel protein
VSEIKVDPKASREVNPPAVVHSRFRASERLFAALDGVFDEERFFLILSVFIGIFSGLAVVCFRLAIDWTHLALLGPLPQTHSWRLFVVPSVTGLVVAILVIHVFPTIRGSGVNQTKAALYIFNGYIPFRTAIGKFLCSALAIGGGHSLGPEDPSLQIGASLASALGRQLQLSREKLRLMAPVGAAAGLAAAFNAPISAVLFVIEEVIGRWSAGILGSVVLSAVASVVIERWFLGSEPLFRIPVTTFKRPAELIAYVVLGIAGGFAAFLFAQAIGYLRPRLRNLPRFSPPLPDFSSAASATSGLRRSWAPATTSWIRPCTANTSGNFWLCLHCSKSLRLRFPSPAELPAACSRPRSSSEPCSAAQSAASSTSSSRT